MEQVQALVPTEVVESIIIVLRGEKVILDRNIARLYEVETKMLVRAVKRNLGRFPEDFMFQLTEEETQNLRCQIGTSSWGGSRYRPYAFTEQGVAMLSGVLRSERAVQVNVEIMRTFVRLRRMAASREDLARKIEALEERYDGQFRIVFDALRQLMAAPEPPDRPIGFE
ncbi:MAG TPA: ORF6N domain-containing protein [Thermoanaerobaculia bacterium]|nr:ORF6N domain-containing protein [Thermoanaerobaculia bacterium]